MARDSGPNLDRLSVIKEDGSRNAPQPADVKGRFVRRRRIVYAVLIAIYVLLPFVHIGGHPAVYLDIESRHFYLFGAIFNGQDASFIVFLLMTLGFGLLFFTAWLGRVWCGWVCPQTVFLEGVYRRVERFFDGPREKRLREAHAPLTPKLLARRVAKHATYLLISLFLAHVFVSFFVSLESLLKMMQRSPSEHWVAFVWMSAVTALLYFNFAWFREQLCIVICPYGRLQSVMQDKHSLVIGYDVRRGEPRGKMTRADREKKVSLPQVQGDALQTPSTPPLQALANEATGAAPAERAKGDCIDCRRCVVVCPTGIDIRNGLQLECIGCAQCIDACDEVMSKIGRPTGLIRYDSLAGLAGEKKKVVRPRLVAYGAAFAMAIAAIVVVVAVRNPFEANLLRVRGAPYVLDGGMVRNQFELHLINKNPVESEFQIKVEAPKGVQVTLPQEKVRLDSLQSFRVPIFVSVQEADYHHPFKVEVEVEDSVSTRQKEVEARFLGPSVRK